jgi:hypothetical protein
MFISAMMQAVYKQYSNDENWIVVGMKRQARRSRSTAHAPSFIFCASQKCP